MKKLLTVVCMTLLFLGAISLSSCQKCSTCSYTYQIVGEPVSTYTYPELCGNSSDINDYEDICASAAAVHGNTCTCVND